MPDGAILGGRIGPNALTQLVPLIEKAGGVRLRDSLLAEAGIFEMPDMTGLIDERPVARLHQILRAEIPDLAPALAWEAGLRTADYVIAHRIPVPAQIALRGLPWPLAAPILARAIAKNAWTFAGSGGFRVVPGWPITFEIADNPVVRGEDALHPICHWHTAVFERLFRRLANRRFRAREVSCCAMGEEACRYEVMRV